MEEFDVIIMGAGIVGLAIASELKDYSALLLERHSTFGREISSRNSEIIHAGIYYPPDTLKAKLCVEGNRLLYEVCEKNKIPHKRIGKLIIAVEDAEITILEELFKQGLSNGIEDLRLLEKKEVKEIEPFLKCKGALFSPNTGILDIHSVMKFFERKSISDGVTTAYGCNVIGIEKDKNSYKVTVQDTDGKQTCVKGKVLINSTGLECVNICKTLGIEEYTLHLCKGEYFRVSAPQVKKLKYLIYPCPTQNSLGIHTVVDVAGNVKLGPNAFYVNEIDYSVDESHKKDFFVQTKRYLPFLQLEDLTPDMSGIRPKLQGLKDNFKDFVIKMEDDKGFPGFINLVGIESPGLTSAPAIALYVRKIIDKYLTTS